jgi:two-component system, OmpR family, response regulator
MRAKLGQVIAAEEHSEDRIDVLLVEDDDRLARLMGDYLASHGVVVTRASDGVRGLEFATRESFDVVLLDIMLPKKSGTDVCRELRTRSDVPIIVITARGEEADRVLGLELGADDYVPKPFSPRELLARLRAVLRRAQPDAAAERLSVAGIEVDVGARSVRVDGADIELTGLELDILVALMRRAGRVVPRSSLLSEAGRGDVAVSERTVDVHISKLRKKLNDDPTTPRRIRTVRGVGYVLAREP